ncbi:MAG: sugar kinase [Candidatus Hydrogenedentes bacterium]|nr:sugar kinase [Candidatus Hydrogenedentota bacterium]
MSITVVGSVALDTVETPAGKNTEGLGGAAVYFSLAAQHFAPVHLVGVIGEDFPDQHVRMLGAKNINLAGLERAPGRTFRWTGRYHEDVNERDTLDTQLNVFEHFHPKVPEAARKAPFLFLGNIHPSLQMEVLEQTSHRFVALDTMNLWINITPDDLRDVLKRVDAVVLNDQEARLLTGEVNLRDAAHKIRGMGPHIIAIKKGEHGGMLFCEADDEIFAIPALPLKKVVDPTGAGDTFAGGFMGYLATQEKTDFMTLKRGVVYGSVMASYTCEAFGPDKLIDLTADQIQQRYLEFKKLMEF